MQYFSWGEKSTHFVAPCMIFFFFLFGCNFTIIKKKIKKKKKKKHLEFECSRVISFIFISCDGMNNAELVTILRLFHEEHNWKILSTIARLADGWMLDMHGS